MNTEDAGPGRWFFLFSFISPSSFDQCSELEYARKDVGGGMMRCKVKMMMRPREDELRRNLTFMHAGESVPEYSQLIDTSMFLKNRS